MWADIGADGGTTMRIDRAGTFGVRWRTRPGRVVGCALIALSLTACTRQTPTEILPFDAAEVRQLFRVQWAGTAGLSGHAFLLDRPGEPPLALTAFHVAGPAFPAPSPDPLVQLITGLLLSPVDPTIGVRLGERLPIVGARTIGAGGSQHDVAAFKVVDWDPTRALQLAADLPAVGDTVSVLAVHVGSGGPDQHPLSGPRRHRARVDVSHDSAFIYTYLESANTNFTSGAAVLNGAGQVVGINVGSAIVSPQGWGTYRARYGPCCDAVRGGEVVGLAVSVRSLRTLLAGVGVTR